jgi:thymidylate kinase
VLEGPDASGKTTQFKKLWSKIQAKNNYNLLLNDRGLMSILAYGISKKRFSDTDAIKSEFLEYLHNHIIIYFTVDPKILKARFDDRGDEIQEWSDIKRVWEVYEELKGEYRAHPNFNIVDGDQSLEDIEFEIDHILDRCKNKPYYCTIANAKTTLRHYGNDEYNTRELINYEMNFDMNHREVLEIGGTQEVSEGLDQIRGEFAQLELDSYNFQYAKFIKKIESVTSGYYGKVEEINSRKFVFTDDECLSYFHILCRNETLYINVAFRSSNIDLFDHDFVSICNMIIIFYKKFDIKYNVALNIKFDSLHKYI